MKKAFLLIIALSAVMLVYSQTVENIQVIPEGNHILIHYRIGESTDMQIYDVTLSCSINGGPRFEPKSVRGDVGDNILGGKSNYTITWDVFEDVDSINNTEFFIKVDLVRDLPRNENNQQQAPFNEPVSVKESEKSTYIGFNGSTYSPFGISVGQLKNSGFYGSIRGGTNNDEEQTDIWVTLIAGFTKHVISSGSYRLHGCAGLGSSIEYYKDLTLNTSWTSPMFAVEACAINVVGRISISTGITFVSGYGVHLVYGVGFLF